MYRRGLVDNIILFLGGRLIDEHIDEVRSRDFEYLRSLSILGLGMTALTMVLGHLMRGIVVFNTEFVILFGYFAVMYAFMFPLKKHPGYIIAASYVLIAPLMAFGILMGTFLDPGTPSLTIMVFMCVLPLFIFDKPWRVLLYLTATAAVYGVSTYFAKTRAVFAIDMIDLVLFYLLGAGVNCLILKDRLRNVEYASTMRRASETDALTSIYNRGAGEQKIRTMIGQSKCGMLCIIDIDGFKEINDRFGHMNGDEVLRAVAGRLCACFRAGDIVTRIGGDEFAVYAVGVRDIATGAICIERLFSQISAMNVDGLDGNRVSISLGATFFLPDEGKSFEELYKESDDALYQAKRCGKAQYFFAQTPPPES
jgi:diguanylate cyclase (GGDEF)-like protein